MEKLRYQLDMTEDSRWEFVTPGSFAKENLLYLQEVGLFRSGPGYFTEREGLSSYLIKLTLAGRGILEYCGEKRELRPGSLFWIDCTAHQRYYTDPEEGRWEVLWVHFSGATAEAYYRAFLRATGGSAAAFPASFPRTERILRDLLALGEKHVLSPEADIRASCLLTDLFLECMEGRAMTPPAPELPDYLVRVREVIDEHYARKLSLAELGRQVNVSPFHLERRFKQAFGLSPADYLALVRLNRAKELLRGTALTIGEVAESIGADESYFIARFKKSEGVTPGEYRRTWRGER